MLFIAVAASVICLIWIALDADTGDVFVVYGCGMRTAWQMKAWSVFVSCGWRFAIIAGVILLNVSLAFQATMRNGIDFALAGPASWGLAVLLAIGLVPWTFFVRTLHQRRRVNANAMRLKEFAMRLCTVPDLSSELEHAQYTTESGWDAWHPKSEYFQSAEGQNLWGGVVPVIYSSHDSPRTLVVPIDWTNFVVWGRPPSFAISGKLLPFCGPGTARFRAGSGVRRLGAAGGCWIVPAELEFPDDTNESG